MIEIVTLRLTHVVGGIFWVGAVLFISFFLMPVMMEAGPAAGPIMGGLMRRKLFVVLPVIALLTILSGFRLMWITSGNFSAEWFATGHGRTYAVGALAALIAFIIGVSVVRPGAARMGMLTQSLSQATDSAERERLGAELGAVRQRNSRANQVVTILLLIAAVAMGIARYMN